MESAIEGDLLIEDGTISSVGRLGNVEAEEVLDGHGRMAVMPSFANAHTHAAMTLLRGLGEELPVKEWLEKRIWPVENNLNPDRIYWGTRSALLEMASLGITCFGDMYFEMDRVAQAAKESGMRCGICRGIIGDDQKRLDEGLALADRYKNDRHVTVQLGPHATYTVSPEMLKVISDMAVDKGISVHFHYLEAEWEVGYIRDELSMTTADYLEKSGLLSVPGLILAHGVWIPEEDMSILADHPVTVVHNPCSNLKLGSGIAPIRSLMAAGIPVALGTDGAASNNRLDIWEEMRTAALIHKGFLKDPTAVKAMDIIDCATYAGHRALGFEKTGRIAQGWNADLVLIGLDKPHYIGVDRDNLAAFIVYAGSSSDVIATVCAGKWIYRDGNFPGQCVEEILRNARLARAEMIRLRQE